MCIIWFHALAGYLQTYETLLKEINAHWHPGSEPVPTDQYEVECAALADCNFNLPCETGIRYPSLVAMMNRRKTRLVLCALTKPSQTRQNRVCRNFVQDPADSCTPFDLQERQASSHKWLDYVYMTDHPTLCWLPTKLAEWIGENLQDDLGLKLIRVRKQEPAGLQHSSTISCKIML